MPSLRFWAVASEVTFEGQAAIALEAAAERGIERRYDFEIARGRDR